MKQVSDPEFEELKNLVTRIASALLGDEKAGIDGIGDKVNKNRKDINALQRLAFIAIGICISAGTIFGIVKIFSQ